MYKIKNFMIRLALIYINFILRNTNVYVICGMRRSGNHALISWLIDALESKNNVEMKKEREIWISDSGRTIHLNEANFLTPLHLIDILRKNKKAIKKSKYFIITLEDYIPKRFDLLIPKSSIRIKVSRNLLNIISSRLKRMNDQAKIGLDRGDMAINKNLLSCAKWIHEDSNGNWIKWSYEKWLCYSSYRASFLEELKLTYDSQIRASANFGGGSSFSNFELGKPQNNPLKRWENIDFPDRVIMLLFNEGLDLLDPKERDYVEKEYRKLKNGKKNTSKN